MKTRYTHPFPILNEKQFLRFRYSVDDEVPEGQCWNWCGHKTRLGYGQFNAGQEVVKAHRMAYFLFHNEDPRGFVIAHKCDNRLCVNPDHLFKTDQPGNIADMIAKGRDRKASGLHHGRCKVTREQIEGIFNDYKNGLGGQRTIAKKYGCPRDTVRKIVLRRSYKEVTYNL